MSTHPADHDDWWWEERVAAALFAQRVKEGRCGNCGVFDGPTHRCPKVSLPDDPDHDPAYVASQTYGEPVHPGTGQSEVTP